jgi:hypothetical protein
MPSLSALQKRLKELEEEIAETERRLPAHSVKPPVMQDLLRLEDEYDAVRDQIRRLRDARNRS